MSHEPASSVTFSRFPAGRLLIFAAIIIAILLLTGRAGTAAAEDNGFAGALDKRYSLARAYYNNLDAHAGLGASQANWEAGIRSFRQIYLARPKHELAPHCLYMMGRMYEEMHERFRNPLDLGEAATYFNDVTLLFPKHRLADDALFRLGEIYLKEKEDRISAAKTFVSIVTLYADGDMAAAAARELAALQDVAAAAAGIEEKRQPGRRAEVLPVKHWSTSDYTRIVVETSEPVLFKECLLEKNAERPRRLYIDFSGSRISSEAQKPVPIQDGLLKVVRAGQFDPDTVRVVLDIESISKYKIFSLQDPFRVVVDVMGQKKEQQVESAQKVEKAAGPPADSKGAPLTLARQLGLGIKRIIIDPGHGGKDPGAIAGNGLKEKDIVLRVAKSLAATLSKELSCEVILTRDRDVFIPLEERTAIANTMRGDLFVSVHVNSAPTPNVHGVETYFLNLTTNEEAMRVAARENATSTNNMSDLQNILADLMNNTKINESARLAGYVQQNMASGLNLKNLGVKQAPFYVLIGAQMPAILCETTFMSDPQEAARLTSESYLLAIAEQLAAGVAGYVKESSLAQLNY